MNGSYTLDWNQKCDYIYIECKKEYYCMNISRAATYIYLTRSSLKINQTHAKRLSVLNQDDSLAQGDNNELAHGCALRVKS